MFYKGEKITIRTQGENVFSFAKSFRKFLSSRSKVCILFDAVLSENPHRQFYVLHKKTSRTWNAHEKLKQVSSENSTNETFPV